jgi:hypothetical protein
MIKLKNMLFENAIGRVSDISRDDIVVGEGGMQLLNSKIAELNKKALKWGLEPVKLEIIKEENVEIKSDGQSISGPKAFKKIYTCKINGRSPQIEGFEFIAKVEHTDGGNIINIAPDSSIKDLPAEYRSSNSKCDVCNTNRERLNTFIIRDTKTDELKTVGSTCLKRFLPIDDVSKFINYAEMLEQIRSLTQEELDDSDREYYGTGSRNYYDLEELLFHICLAYLVNGKIYISKKRSEELYDDGQYVESTVQLAQSIMFYSSSQYNEEPEFIKKSKLLRSDANELTKKVLEFVRNRDFKVDATSKPEMSNYFNNLEVLKNSSVVNLKNLGYIGGMLSSYLIEQNLIKKRNEESEKKISSFVGQIGSKISTTVSLKTVRGYDGQYGHITIYNFQDKDGNDMVWFSSNDLELKEGENYQLTATVKDHKTSDPKYGSKKQTILTRAKVKTIEGDKINENSYVNDYKNYF